MKESLTRDEQIPWNKGKKLSEVTKKRMSISHLGAKNQFYGKKHSKETIKKMKENHANYKGDKNPCWKGGVIKNKEGYIFIYSPDHPNAVNNYVREHILIAEKNLGRYLDKTEVIHHIDYDKSNNKFDNLFITNHKGHAKTHCSVYSMFKVLLKNNVIYFDKKKGKYFLTEKR